MNKQMLVEFSVVEMDWIQLQLREWNDPKDQGVAQSSRVSVVVKIGFRLRIVIKRVCLKESCRFILIVHDPEDWNTGQPPKSHLYFNYTLFLIVQLKNTFVCIFYIYMCVCWSLKFFRLLFATPWTVACQTPLFMEFSRQEYWSRLPFPFPGDLPKPGT